MPTSITSTGITFPNSTTQSTAGYPNTNPSGFTSNTGTVTSVATGNGLSGGTITTTGTLTVACPTWNTVGSDACGIGTSTGGQSGGFPFSPTLLTNGTNYSAAAAGISGASGTWKCMGRSGADYVYFDYVSASCNIYRGIYINNYVYIFCRVS